MARILSKLNKGDNQMTENINQTIMIFISEFFTLSMLYVFPSVSPSLRFEIENHLLRVKNYFFLKSFFEKGKFVEIRLKKGR
ncbi:MAG TPA: hypothetical protein HPP56_07340 [Nitrospirae bacterium]|nr:hypothetical protein [Nitrospirota bacterium]